MVRSLQRFKTTVPYHRFSTGFYTMLFIFISIICMAYIITTFIPLYRPYVLFIVHLCIVILVCGIALQLWMATRFDVTNIIVQQGAIFMSVAFLQIANLVVSDYMIIGGDIFDGKIAQWFDLAILAILPLGLLAPIIQKPREVTLAYRKNIYILSFIVTSAYIWGGYIYFRLHVTTFSYAIFNTWHTYISAIAAAVMLYAIYRCMTDKTLYIRNFKTMAIATSVCLFFNIISTNLHLMNVNNAFLLVQLTEIIVMILLFRMTYFVSIEQPYLQVQASRQQLKQIAYYDDVTGLPNKQYLVKQLMKRIDGCPHESAFIIVKIDRLAHIRSILGEHSVDNLMKIVVEQIRQIAPPDMLLGRVSENQLLITCQINKKDFLTKFCDRLLQQLIDPVELNEYAIQVHPIIGVAIYQRHAKDIAQLIKMAQMAVEDASIQNVPIKYYEGELSIQQERIFQIENDLQYAIENDEIYLEYQPKLNTVTGKVDALEALLRWQHPKQGFVSPANFIPVLEKTGMMATVGRWILHRACQDGVRFQELYQEDIKVAVNLSISQLMQGKIVEDVANALAQTNLQPSLLELEITESMSMNIDSMVPILTGLKALGVQIAIDDFGTGYSSLAYLSDFPADTLKIDRSFVNMIGINQRGEAIVDTVITLANKLGLQLVAEGVETDQQLDYVVAQGCHYIQGYYVSKPLRFELLKQEIDRIHTKFEFTYN